MEVDRNTGDEREGGSRTHSGEYTAESIDLRSDGDTEREDGDKAVQELSRAEEETLLGKPFLEPRILCKYGRVR